MYIKIDIQVKKYRQTDKQTDKLTVGANINTEI